MNQLRVLIVDDEPLARERIRELLRLESDVEISEASRGKAALERIQTGNIDIVFLDIHLPDMSGLDVAERAEHMPVTVFVTAYDEHAVDAFEVAAVDYLVKPFDDERFAKALERARGVVAARLPLGNTSEAWCQTIAVPERGKTQIIPIKTIDYITSSGPYVEIHASGKTHLLRTPLQILEQRLDPAVFVRIHRTAIVRLELVSALHYGGGGDYSVRLVGGERLPVSRMRKEYLEGRLSAR